MTRAKDLLIVSGVANDKKSSEDGMAESSWYARLAGGENIEVAADTPAIKQQGQTDFTWPLFDPPLLAVLRDADSISSAAIDEGVALHALMEKLTHRAIWPVDLPHAEKIAHWLSCSLQMASAIRAQALEILRQPQLERFFNPAFYRFARNEMEVVVGSQVMRFDRLVELDDAVWILDYKRNLLDSERSHYQAQMRRYRQAAQTLFEDKRIQTGLITSDGKLWEME
jgi:ATP-dependent helicase/nuclease subunit A